MYVNEESPHRIYLSALLYHIIDGCEKCRLMRGRMLRGVKHKPSLGQGVFLVLYGENLLSQDFAHAQEVEQEWCIIRHGQNKTDIIRETTVVC